VSLECVVNVSEGRDGPVVKRLAATCGQVLLDVHSDRHHHRSVLTLAGQDEVVEAAVRLLAAAAVSTIDFGLHSGEHPALGAVDVVPFVPLAAAVDQRRPGAGTDGPAPKLRLAAVPPLDRAVAARDRFARWAGSELGLPCFLFGPLPPTGHRTLTSVRRNAFAGLEPDTGPRRPHARAGSCTVGARHFLVAYNVWLAGGDVALARTIAGAVRGPAVRALGLDMGGVPQVSCNLVDPLTIGPAEIHDRIAQLAGAGGAGVDRCELVGLVPAAVLAAVPPARWAELDLRPEDTIEARLEERDIAWR
jgi:glutamate formiminotransferase / 5-formyltetrahydrofolate cyclo-ligase